mmetsp:Transcript_60642/g.54619  ORF Transcript_60642/g.54619 Transcript_60642/m.54619 type:complete len:204 (+) Transcript_60642:1-612(+)
MKMLIDEKTNNYHLEIIINNIHRLKFYIKSVGPTALASAMDIDKNDHRMSYAPEILIKVSDNIVMVIRCTGSCVGVGFWNLVKWKKESNGINTSKDDIHSMIHICDSYDSMSKVEILFGVKGGAKIDDIGIKVTNEDGPVTLYPIQQQNSNNNSSRSSGNLQSNITDNSNNYNNRKRSISSAGIDDTVNDNSSTSSSKRRRLN